MTKILLVNGPNLNLLGTREPEVYGFTTLSDIEQMVIAAGKRQKVDVLTCQSNSEGKLIDFMQTNQHANGIIINPGAFTHYSYAIRDCLAGLEIPTVEVHISHNYQREE